MSKTFVRSQISELSGRLSEPRRFIQVVAGPRQVGKTTLVRQVLNTLGEPSHYASADEPSLKDSVWLSTQWRRARRMAIDPVSNVENGGSHQAVLVVDEVQKIDGWSETVKRLWDEDSNSGIPLKVVLLGSAPLLMQQGLSESLAGRFEVLRLPHWSFSEMSEAFGFSLEQYILYGGYPGAAPLINDFSRWRQYLLDALIETTISRDVLLMTRVDKPALLRRLFELSCNYSGQILSYTKMLGQLVDAGNTTTLAHYLDLLRSAGMVRGLPKYAGATVRQRASSPKLQVFNSALQTAQSGLDPKEIAENPERWGRWVESAVGAHLANADQVGECNLYYWRHGNHEVDFVLTDGDVVLAVEVKSGVASARSRARRGVDAFRRAFPGSKGLLVGGDGIPIGEFLGEPIKTWLREP